MNEMRRVRRQHHQGNRDRDRNRHQRLPLGGKGHDRGKPEPAQQRTHEQCAEAKTKAAAERGPEVQHEQRNTGRPGDDHQIRDRENIRDIGNRTAHRGHARLTVGEPD